MKSSRPIRALISPAAIAANYRLVKKIAHGAKAWAVIKANAYGHGQWRAVDGLREIADGFALLETENAVALRDCGIKQPILLLEGIFSSADARAVAQYELTPVVHCLEQLEMLLAHWPAAQQLPLYLKLNTGMNRLGLNQAQLDAALALLEDVTVNLTWMTHFAEADGPRGIEEQLQRFRSMTAGKVQRPVSLANSAAILDFPAAHQDWVRPGIMLYGGSPFAGRTASSFGLQTTMTLESAIIAVQDLQAGDRVGYGGTFVATQKMRIGIVACGYADGYPRHAPTGTPVAVMGHLTHTVGRVSMDMLAVDLSDVPEAGIGAPVTLWGEGVAGVVDVDQVAASAGTISYELFCALAPRVPVSVVT